MLQKLKQRWGVNNLNLILIICTFAIGGSLCGKTGAKLLELAKLDKDLWWWLSYIVLVTLLWPFFVLAISIPTGQFVFFKKYLIKVWERLSGKHKLVINVAIFASGTGSNAQKIIDFFKNVRFVKIALIVCNNPKAGVLDIAKNEGIPYLIIEKQQFINGDNYLLQLKEHKIAFIVLAGFLWKIPVTIINAFPNKIVNIHPALLPKYGGKGMFGNHVHQAIIDAKEIESGITIHYVDEWYDHGNSIHQFTCPVDIDETAESLAKKIHVLEHQYYPVTIAALLEKLK
jgi:formyltetrahydrofolate-dependent phosphoribosylglycinamide formyltransferase